MCLAQKTDSEWTMRLLGAKKTSMATRNNHGLHVPIWADWGATTIFQNKPSPRGLRTLRPEWLWRIKVEAILE
jgi:hypothetical protein